MKTIFLVTVITLAWFGVVHSADVCTVDTLTLNEDSRATKSLVFDYSVTDGGAASGTSQCSSVQACFTPSEPAKCKDITSNPSGSLTYPNLDPGTEYTVTITATATDSTVHPKDVSAFTKPIAPTDVRAVPGTPPQTTLTVTWVEAEGGYDTTKVVCDSHDDHPDPVTVTRGVTTADCTGLTAGTEYSVEVTSMRVQDESALSELTTGTTGNCSHLFTKSECCEVKGCGMIECPDGDKCMLLTQTECPNAINGCPDDSADIGAEATSSLIDESNSTANTTIAPEPTPTGTPAPTPTPTSTTTEKSTSTTTKGSTTAAGPTPATTKKPTPTPTPQTPTPGPQTPTPTPASPTPTPAPQTPTPAPQTPTPAPQTPTPTPVPTETTTEKKESSGRKFDTASFFGGMILMLGVLLIVFFSCKYYKSRTEARYRQF